MTDPVRFHCPYCRRSTLQRPYLSVLCPDTYACLECGHPQKHTNLDSNDTLSVDETLNEGADS